MVGFNRRFAPMTEAMRRELDGVSDRVFLVRVNAGPLPAEHWMHDPHDGGGRLLGEGCHFVDLLAHLAGSPPVTAQAVASPQPLRPLECSDNLSATSALRRRDDRRPRLFGGGRSTACQGAHRGVRRWRLHRDRRLPEARDLPRRSPPCREATSGQGAQGRDWTFSRGSDRTRVGPAGGVIPRLDARDARARRLGQKRHARRALSVATRTAGRERLSWYVRRLRRMGSAEIVARTVRLRTSCSATLRAGTFSRSGSVAGSHRSETSSGVRSSPSRWASSPPSERRRSRRVVRKSLVRRSQGPSDALAGKVRFFGYPEVELPSPIDYSFDPLTKRQVAGSVMRSSSTIGTQEVGDPKWIWELNRCQELPVLVQAWLLTEDDTLRRRGS